MPLSLLDQIWYPELTDSFVSMVQLTLQFMETQLCLTFHSCNIVFPFLAAIYFFKPDYLVASRIFFYKGALYRCTSTIKVNTFVSNIDKSVYNADLFKQFKTQIRTDRMSDGQNISPDLGPNCLTLLNIFFLKQ